MTNQPPTSRNKPIEAVKQAGHSARNAAAQFGRIPGGVAQGVLKTVGALPMAVEAFDAMKDLRIDTAVRNEKTAAVRSSGETYTQAQLIDARAAGHITQQQYDNTINEWRAGGNPFDRAVEASYTTAPAARPITEGIAKANTAVENWTNSWVPAPETGVAQFVATAADAIGEAIPGVAAAMATGGGSAATLIPTSVVGRAVGALNAVGTEMIEGSGDVGRAALAGATEWASEAIGAATFNKAAGAITNKVGSVVADAIGEGIEEVIGSGIQSAVTGDAYSLADAAYEFGIGTVVGGAFGGGTGIVNAVNTTAATAQVERAVNARTSETAKADIADVKALIDNAGDSSANAVVAHDSLVALQRQVANPINEVQATRSVPSDIAERFGLTPASDNSRGKPLEINARSYESFADPLARGLDVPDVSSVDRATVSPNAVDSANPRALYQYAEDIYLRPGTDVSGDTLFTYRGQANQFYRTSLEPGAIPASGVGTSWEGSGGYSSPGTYTTDAYGPSGMLADNPHSNRGIPQKAVASDSPIGLILQQPASLTEDVAPLTRTDAPTDVVPEGTRRIRYDDRGRGLVTEVINNPADVSGAGLIFGRTTVDNATPIQYATNSDAAALQNTPAYAQAVGSSDSAPPTTAKSAAEEVRLGAYTVPELISTETVRNASIGAERNAAESVLESAPESPSPHNRASAQQAAAPPEGGAERELGSKITGEPQMSVASAAAASVNSSAASEHNAGAAANAKTPAVPNATGANTPPEETTAEEQTPQELSPEERASQIWTPLQVQTKTAQATTELERKRERRREVSRNDPDLVIGQGSRGAIHETQGYAATFGLSAG